MKKLSGKERRFKKDTNHVISSYIISKVAGTWFAGSNTRIEGN